MAATNATVPMFFIPPPTRVDNEHKVFSIAAAIIVIGVVTTILVGARLTYRFWKKNQGLDDYAIIVSLFMFIGWTVLGAYANLAAGIGKPLTEVTLPEFTVWFKCLVAITFLYPWTSASIRVSILLFYRRIFEKGSGTARRWVLWALLGLQGAYILAFTLLPLAICSPLYYAWDPLQRSAHCNLPYWYYVFEGQYATSLVLDVCLLVYPMIPLLRLQMPLKKRLGVVFIFLLGAGASVAAAVKLALWVAKWSQTVPDGIPDWFDYEVAQFTPPQFDHQGLTVFIPSQVEPALGLIGASMPALWPLVRSGAQRIYGQVSTSSRSKGHGARSLGSNGEHERGGMNGSYNVIKIGMHHERKFYPLAGGDSDVELKAQGRGAGDARW